MEARGVAGAEAVGAGVRLRARSEAVRDHVRSLNRPVQTEDVWWEAETFEDLCSAMVRFIEGELQWSPVHLGPLMEESDDLVPYLRRLNLAGFMTTSSQPTEEGAGWDQLAYVEGFAREEEARRIEQVVARGSLGVVLTAPGETGGRGRYGDLHPFIDGYPSPEWISDSWAYSINKRAVWALRDLWHVVAFDTNDRDPWRLWRNVLEALEGPPAGWQRLFDVQGDRDETRAAVPDDVDRRRPMGNHD
jgi:hypothetical protein